MSVHLYGAVTGACAILARIRLPRTKTLEGDVWRKGNKNGVSYFVIHGF